METLREFLIFQKRKLQGNDLYLITPLPPPPALASTVHLDDSGVGGLSKEQNRGSASVASDGYH